jgi:hypothetical protein
MHIPTPHSFPAGIPTFSEIAAQSPFPNPTPPECNFPKVFGKDEIFDHHIPARLPCTPRGKKALAD